ncbi:AAA family ATPase [Lactiplantibacillus sp. WILCCON 0030]|uniref:AAA family ATPase n=1 Tax=Lactiplantibacillus brownii TaxID=3069269 RepID=A0ABU1A751_9LACO|nr:AAA family ATPase [Lactiplantibacillus brownii]MDQ7936760.1 AAA family ATPase [Lactiplantibacillus brownii]
MLKLIGFKIYGHALFEDGTQFTIQTASQVTERTKDRIIKFNQILTLNRVIGIVGINATGKSTLMNIFEGLSDFYLKSLSIDQTALNEAFRSNERRIRIIAFLAATTGERYRVETSFDKNAVESNDMGRTFNWKISEEKIYSDNKLMPKSKYFDFENQEPIQQRTKLSKNELRLLSNKDSIFRIISQASQNLEVLSTVSMTDSNIVRSFADETPTALLEYLDNSIDYLKYQLDSEGKTLSYHLKFKRDRHEIVVSQLNDISKYISSGTIKGITLFYEFLIALRHGSTLLVDEIELHVNKQIVRDFIGFFANPKVNVNQATLIYSSHYVELTDDLKRQDEEYVLLRNGVTKLRRLNDTGVRTELKNSDIFQSNYFKGTAPNYERYINLKKTIVAHNQRRFDVDTDSVSTGSINAK